MNNHKKQQNMSILDIIWHFKFQLMAYVIAISFVTFFGLYVIDGVPNELRMSNQTVKQTVTTPTAKTPIDPSIVPGSQGFLKPIQAGTINSTQGKGELPVRVLIEKIGVDTVVVNPSSTNVDALNNELLKGAVRYPGSGTLGNGNMFIFGHSTSIKIVNNKAFKAFNNAKDLNIGDIIRVRSNSHEYTYKVTSVSLVESDKQFIDLKSDKNMLTIATCNVLGEKEERFVIEALFSGSVAL